MPGALEKLFVCGHSLGAALAELAAHRFALADYPVAGVYVRFPTGRQPGFYGCL
ncbi:MAG: hypothetical protein IPG32_16410 [Saprospirales bacterium]|nr:hypothetical protein [Saprospirales bacterium]